MEARDWERRLIEESRQRAKPHNELLYLIVGLADLVEKDAAELIAGRFQSDEERSERHVAVHLEAIYYLVYLSSHFARELFGTNIAARLRAAIARPSLETYVAMCFSATASELKNVVDDCYQTLLEREATYSSSPEPVNVFASEFSKLTADPVLGAVPPMEHLVNFDYAGRLSHESSLKNFVRTYGEMLRDEPLTG